MDKNELVMLKIEYGAFHHGNSEFLPNHYYRCMPYNDGYLIFGEWFTEAEYAEFFDLVYDRVMKDFVSLELVKADGSPISKTKFKKMADIHQYGNYFRSYKIWYFRNSRESIYGFYPMQGNAIANHNECYSYYLSIVLRGDVSCLDEGDVCFGNKGIPISYSKLGVY